MPTLKVAFRGALSLTAFLSVSLALPATDEQDWTHFVRIAAYPLTPNNAESIVESAKASNVSGIEVDNDIPGRYESFLDPRQKLQAIRKLATRAHEAGNHAFVYIAGTECITAHGDVALHTLAKDHPDWLQRDIHGKPAIFGAGDAFWITKGDEDVWITPYAPQWRKTYMERVQQIAATGIDGIYIDIPYWMTHFTGWENTWASFDDYTVAEFKKETGLDARKDLKIGDFTDANFRRWVDFRLKTMTEFLHDIAQNAKSVNPQIKIIPEIYPGIEEEVIRVGADPYRIYPVVDAIAHEYEFGEGDHTAAARTPLNWFHYQVGIASFRAFAEGKPTWILNYSWDGNKGVDPKQAMQNLAMSEVMAGANVWDARGHVMSGSNDLPTRKQIFSWIEKNQTHIYSARSAVQPVGVYFSPASRDYFVDQFLPSYEGVLMLLMQAHLEYQIVTPRTLPSFKGKALVLPDVHLLDDTEKDSLKHFLAAGNSLIVTGTDATGLQGSARIVRFGQCPGKRYLATLEKDFGASNPTTERDFLQSLEPANDILIKASPSVATQIGMVNGRLHIFVANFGGLIANRNPVQTPEVGAEITVRGHTRAHFLPFLGLAQDLNGKDRGDVTTYTLPPIQKGAILWFDTSSD